MTTILNYSMIKKVLIVLPFYLFTFLPYLHRLIPSAYNSKMVMAKVQ